MINSNERAFENFDKAAALGCTVGGVFLTIGALFCIQKQKQQRKIRDLEQKRVFSPDEIKSIIETNDPLVQRLFVHPKDSSQMVAHDMLIYGEIANKYPLKSLLDESSERLVVRVHYKFPKFTDSQEYQEVVSKRMDNYLYFKRLKTGKSIYTRVLPTIPIERNNVICNAIFTEESIENIDKSCFDHLASQQSEKQLNIFQWLWNPIGLMIAFLPSLFGLDFRSSLCFALRFESCEIGVRNKGLAMFLGDLVYDLDNGSMAMTNPMRMMKSKVETLQKLKGLLNNTNGSANYSFICSAVFFLVGGTLLVKALQHKSYLRVFGKRINMPNVVVRVARAFHSLFTRKKAILQVGVNSLDNSFIDSTYTNPREDILCVICYEKSRSLIIRPCLHCSLCIKCFDQLQKPECPVCKAHIIGVVPIIYKE